MAQPQDNNAVIVGISGVSSSGKTTLARLLRDVFPGVFILHEDDFYKTDNEIPVKDGVADWDCLEAIDLPKFEEALSHIRTQGVPPSWLASKEDKNSVGQVSVDHAVVDALGWQASRWQFQDIPPIAIIDGFLLYSEGMKTIRDQFDVKIFLRTTHETAKQRREARQGYVTIEGFWEDPPGYVDKVVWPNYAKDHAFLFKDGNVEGAYDEDKVKALDIRPAPDDTQADMTACLKWAYAVLTETLEARIAR